MLYISFKKLIQVIRLSEDTCDPLCILLLPQQVIVSIVFQDKNESD